MNGGMSAVRGYFEAIFSGGTVRVSRPLKVVIVGKESVGKTRYELPMIFVGFFGFVFLSMRHRFRESILLHSFDNADR